MIPLPLAWTLLALTVQMSGSSLILQQETLNILYPTIRSTPAIDCDCVNISCDSVYWFRSTSSHSKVQYIGKFNRADRSFYGEGLDEARFKFTRKSGASFTLRIVNVTEADAGIYSCVLRDKKSTEMWKSGILLRPGVTAPTLAPMTKPKPPVKSVCRCSSSRSQDGCSSLILWSLVGLIVAIALALICTLYYFSRLPKKCRHHFVKKRLMT